jgi:predicted nucleic acid-binding protein
VPSATNADAAFWDTSGVVLLCTHQAAAGAARRIAQRCRRIVLWWGTPVEARSAFMRLVREGVLSSSELAGASRRLATLTRVASEIEPTQEIRTIAESVLDKHDLRAADAFQLAAALVLCHEKPRGRWFVCFDRRLAAAADVTGFTVLPTPR